MRRTLAIIAALLLFAVPVAAQRIDGGVRINGAMQGTPLNNPIFTGQWTVNTVLCATGTVIQGGSPTTCTATPTVTSILLGGGSATLTASGATVSCSTASCTIQVPSGGSLGAGSSFFITSTGVSGQMKLQNDAANAGVGLDLTTDSTLYCRNRAYNADCIVRAGTFSLGSGNAVTTSGTITQIKSGDAGAYLTVDNGIVGVNSGVLKLLNAGTGNTLISTTAPTISSGFGTSPAILSNNGSATFRINVGTGGTATSGVIGLPTAAAGWNCVAVDLTNNTVTRQTASSTTTATLTAAAAWAASDTLLVQCLAY